MLNFFLGKNISPYVRRHRRLVAGAFVLTAISSLFVVIPAYLLQPFVDEGMKTGSDPTVWRIPWIAFSDGSWFNWQRTEITLVDGLTPNRLLVLLTFVAFLSSLFKSITIYLACLAAAAFSNRAVRTLRIDLYEKFLSLHLGFYHDKKSGELVARATADLTIMQTLISYVLLGLMEYPLTIAVFLCYLFVMNYKLTLLVFFIVPIIGGLIRLFGRKVKKHSGLVQDATADVTSAYQESLIGIKVVQGFFMGKNEINKFVDRASHRYKRIMHWNRWHLGLSPMMDPTVFIVFAAVLITGKIYFNHSLGEIVSMLYAFSRVYKPVKGLAMVNNNLKTLQGATNKVFGIMHTKADITDHTAAKDLSPHKESITFSHVSFGYSPSSPVLKDVNFNIKAGEMVAFVGSTGAGKSTLLDLIPRFYDVTEGSIAIDNMDIRNITLKSLRRQIGIVNQEVMLFHDTIANNLRYGSPEKNEADIIAAAKVAHAHDFIESQPNGYETIIGDQGVLLSGGQRQRIAIARAILIHPAILILDEAASALDTESEKHIQRAIEKLQGSLTIIIVAHRLSTVMRANRIFVMESGRIIESGSIKELLALDGRFRQLYDLQFSEKTNK